MNIECEKCHAPGTPDRNQCVQCGGRVVRVCGSCGLKNSLAKRFCDSCGSRLDAQAQKPPAAAAPPPPPPPKASSPKAPPPDVFVFESLAESAANELEEKQRQKAAQAKAPGAKRPEPKAPDAKAPPEPVKPPEPVRPPEPEKPKPAPAAPGLNALDLKLDMPRTSKPASPPPSLGLPHTVIGRVGAPPPQPKKPSGGEPGRAPPPPEPPSAKAPPPAEPRPKAEPPPSPPPARRVEAIPSITRAVSQAGAKLSTAAAVVLLLVGAGLWYSRKRHLGRPEVQVPATARKYLNAVKAGDLQGAYGMLSEASRRYCPLSVFKTIRDNASWEFSDVSTLALEGDLAFVRYRLRVGGRDAEEDHLVFVREGGAWRRAFAWSLLRDAEDYLDRGLPSEALNVARQAREVNPRDPVAQGYACEALYYLKDPKRGDEVVRECRIALELAEKYPSALSLTPASLYHVRAILGDTFKNTLRRYEEAIDQYTALLLFPRVLPPDQCEVLLGRTECWLALRKYDNAVKDAGTATRLCERPGDLEYARRTAAIFGGGAQKEAIELAQNHRLEAGGQTLFEWRKQARADLTKQWKAQGRGTPPAEDWHAQHLGGAQYRVDVRAGSTVLFSARVDLLERTVQAETN